MSSRAVFGLLIGATVALALRPAGAEDAPAGVGDAATRLRSAVTAEATPDLVAQIEAKDPAAAELRQQLSAHADVVEPIVAAALEAATALARRDGKKAVDFADWLEGLAHEARKGAPGSIAACRALRDAHLLRGRVASALVEPVSASAWIDAADLVIECAELEGASGAGDDAWVRALAIVEEGTRGERAALVSLLDHADVLCRRALEGREAAEPLRRAVVASYALQADTLHATSRKRAQRALLGFFDAFAPLAQAERAALKDIRTWNRRVGFVRELDIDVKVEYLGRTCSAVGGLLSFLLPDTGRWTIADGAVRQVLPSRNLFRRIWFDTYDWDSVYGLAGSPRTVGGDNVKGVAGRNFDTTLAQCEQKGLKVKRTQKPKRTQWNKRLPAGIAYEIEYEDTDGLLTRERSFLVKAVKAEKTIQIIIIEAVALTERDPEYEAIIDSLDITKKTR